MQGPYNNTFISVLDSHYKDAVAVFDVRLKLKLIRDR